MRSALTSIHIHIVWATWDRMPLISPERKPVVYMTIISECNKQRCEVLAIGGIDDHVHLLIRHAPTIGLSALVRNIKGISSHACGGDFKWQGGYAAFCIERPRIPTVTKYIQNQEEHHRTQNLIPFMERTS